MGPISTTVFDCTGEEVALQDCSNYTRSYNCYTHVGVKCEQGMNWHYQVCTCITAVYVQDLYYLHDSEFKSLQFVVCCLVKMELCDWLMVMKNMKEHWKYAFKIHGQGYVRLHTLMVLLHK